jgi:hypothetical protein
MIAQLPQPTGSQLLIWLGCAAIVIGAAAGLLALVNQFFTLKRNVVGKRKTEILPSPLEVREAHEFAKERDCADRHRLAMEGLAEIRQQRITDAKDAAGSRKGIYTEIESVRKEMGDMERRLNTADEERTQALHGRLNDILLAVGELRGKVN